MDNKKRHTVKNQITINNSVYILHKVAIKRKKKHDYEMYENNHTVIPKEVVNVFDVGYLGLEKAFSEQKSNYSY